MIKRFVPLFLIAFVTGFLFRMGDQYGIPVLRMFGTWGIAVIGIWGSLILRAIQREDGIRRLEESLRSLGANVEVERVATVGALPVWMLKTPKGKILLGASDVANSVRARRAQRILDRHVRAMFKAAWQKGVLAPSEKVQAALVLLRRAVKGEGRLKTEEGASVALVNPETLAMLIR